MIRGAGIHLVAFLLAGASAARAESLFDGGTLGTYSSPPAPVAAPQPPDVKVQLIPLPDSGSPAPGDWRSFFPYLDTLPGVTDGGRDRIEFLVDGTQVMPRLREALSAARSTIHLEIYQLKAEPVGWEVAGMLAAKAKDGVKVRVLLDGFGAHLRTQKGEKALIASLKDAGVEVRLTKSGLDPFHVDHRKLLVVDGAVAFTGGMNLGDAFQVLWHDQWARIEGPAVARLQQTFADQWKSVGGSLGEEEAKELPPEPIDGVETRIVPHKGGKDRVIEAAYLRAIKTAASSIDVADPYFAAPEIFAALEAAARRGVRVRLVLPRENNEKLLREAARGYYPDLIAAGIEVYEYQGRMAHDKVAVMDGLFATFGSSNLDRRSLVYNDELNIMALDSRLAANIEERLFGVDIGRSQRITEYHPTALERLARKLSPWL